MSVPVCKTHSSQTQAVRESKRLRCCRSTQNAERASRNVGSWRNPCQVILRACAAPSCVNCPGSTPAFPLPPPSGRFLKVVVFLRHLGFFTSALQHDCLQHQLLKPRASLDLFRSPKLASFELFNLVVEGVNLRVGKSLDFGSCPEAGARTGMSCPAQRLLAGAAAATASLSAVSDAARARQCLSSPRSCLRHVKEVFFGTIVLAACFRAQKLRDLGHRDARLLVRGGQHPRIDFHAFFPGLP